MARSHLVVALGATLALSPVALAGGLQKAETPLVRLDNGVDEDATGTLRVSAHLEQQAFTFEVRAENVNPEWQPYVLMEFTPGGGDFSYIGDLEVSGNALILDIDTKDGDVLPFEFQDIASLQGRVVQITIGEVSLLQAVVPDVEASSKPVKAKQTLGPADDGAPKLKAKLKLRSKPSKGDERFDLMVKHLGFDDAAEFSLFVEDDVDSDVFADAGDMERIGSSAHGRYRRFTKKGQALPLGVSSLSELAGRRFEVRDGDDGVHVEGVLPDVDG
jgi:hypothetical protein